MESTPKRSSRSPTRILSGLIRPFTFLADTLLFLFGLFAYFFVKRTPRVCFHAMRRLYGPSNGAFNRAALTVTQRLRPVTIPTAVNGFLGKMTQGEVTSLVRKIDEQGFAVFDRKVPEALCEELRLFAKNTPALPIGASEPELYDPSTARALRYDYAEADILGEPAANRIIFDGFLATIAGAYFNCRPVYDFSAMWWTTPFGEKNYSLAAQKYHFDMDRLVFLKFFIYLTDVTPETGPHVYVCGSHKEKPRNLREPIRFSDAEVESGYPAEAIMPIFGESGSIFAVDTLGLHKGMPVVNGDRLVFQIEFAINKFGQNYPRVQISEKQLRSSGVEKPIDRHIFRNVVD